MGGWLGEIVGFVLGVVGSFALLFVDPVRQRVKRWIVAKDPSPLVVSATANYASIWSGHPNGWLGQSFYVPKADLGKAPPGVLVDWPEWIQDQGGAAEGELFVLITLVSDLDATVVLRPPIVEVERRDFTPEATRLRYLPQGGASMLPLVTFDVSLAMGHSTIAPDPAHRDVPLSWRLTKGEARQFLVRARPGGTGVYSWALQLPVIVGGKETIQRIDDAGAPFVTAGLAEDQPDYSWAGGAWRPTPR